MDESPRTYRRQSAWAQLQEHLPAAYRLAVEREPREIFWNWRGHEVHLDRFDNPCSPVRLVLHHGVGTNGRQMSLILGAPLADAGFDVTSIDNLGYGMTRARGGAAVRYDDWVDLVVDHLRHLRAQDERPLYLFGLSAGGMLAFHVAAAAPAGLLSGIVGTTFLDQRVHAVRAATAHDRLTARLGGAPLTLLCRVGLGDLRVPMRLVSKMSALVNDRNVLRLMQRDPSSAGNRVPIEFLRSYLNYTPRVEPADFDACPVLHVQPERDEWSPGWLSDPVLSAIHRVAVRRVGLENAGHYPIEEPGLSQLSSAIEDFVGSHR